jgi:hypothetical protein
VTDEIAEVRLSLSPSSAKILKYVINRMHSLRRQP